jgi:spore maturation protein CgeB
VDKSVPRVSASIKSLPVGRQALPTSDVEKSVMPELPEFKLPSRSNNNRTDVTAAVILDEFSELAFTYEWNQVSVTPAGWREQLEAIRPHLLFVESAWNGNSRSWRLHMTRQNQPSEELQALVEWCKAEGIPTVFWNKEDPPNYDRFIETAKLFDHVFTVDADCIQNYRRDLGHEQVGLLPFAAQPRIHNPIRRGPGRAYDVTFAGTYFPNKHPERRKQMDYILDPAREFDLHIYSRLETIDDRYRYPKHLSQHVIGSLPYTDMLSAYTSYKLFLNVNSVNASPTMCARRLFELSAAQTAVLSAPSPAIPNYFGNDIAVAHDGESARTQLRMLLKQRDLRERHALRAHRRVFDSHLYTHRVDEILRTVGVESTYDSTSPAVSVIVPTNRPDQLPHIFAMLGSQSFRNFQLVLVPHSFEAAPQELELLAKNAEIGDIVVRLADESLTLGACMNLGVEASDGTYIAKMDDDNWYGPNYLLDLVRAFSYTDASVVGKWAHYVHLEAMNATVIRFAKAEHRYSKLVQGGTIITQADVARDLKFEDLPRRVDTTFLDKVRASGGKVYSSDRFNFVSVRRADTASHTWKISDTEILRGDAELIFYGEPFSHAEV